jgi:hypothetical protein
VKLERDGSATEALLRVWKFLRSRTGLLNAKRALIVKAA